MADIAEIDYQGQTVIFNAKSTYSHPTAIGIVMNSQHQVTAKVIAITPEQPVHRTGNDEVLDVNDSDTGQNYRLFIHHIDPQPLEDFIQHAKQENTAAHNEIWALPDNAILPSLFMDRGVVNFLDRHIPGQTTDLKR